MLDYINGNKFADMSDFVIDLNNQNFNIEMYRKNSILYCKTDFINKLFNFINFSNRKYVLITHMSDYDITQSIFQSKPKSIIKWYAENATYNHSDLIPIPIGCFLAVRYFNDKEKIVRFLFLSIFIWSVLGTLLYKPLFDAIRHYIL